VTSIDSYAFSGCSSLKKVIVPDIAAWCNISFGSLNANPLFYAEHIYSDENTEITDLVIPNSVTSIGRYAFYGCTNLSSISLPNSIRYIYSKAFDNTLWYNNQPDGVLYLGNYVYGYKGQMSEGTSVVLKEGSTMISYAAFDGCSRLTSITIPNSVTSIGDYAFRGCSSLASIIVSNNVTHIGDYAFDGTPWLKNQPDGLLYIGKIAYKFIGTMPANASVVIKDGTTQIANKAFSGCSGLKFITIPNSVTSIGEEVFKDCSNLASITIPNSVTRIGYSAFSGCRVLSSINIPDGVTSIGRETFKDCSNLASITIPNSVTRIDYSAFENCRVLSSINIPDGVTTIESRTFRGCYGLTSVSIPNSVTNIMGDAFYGCSDLPSVTIPNGVTNIGEYAFYGCSGLTSITIPDGVPGVNYGTFQNCSGLTNVIIGCNVKYLGGEAFDWCNSVKELICLPTTPPDCYNGSNLAGINKSECILKVPIGSKQAYQDAEYWNKFQLIVEADVTAIGSIRADEPADGKIESIYDINGSRRSSLQRGINIIRMSDGTTKKVVAK